MQPKDRAIRYNNLRSALAEEGVIRLLMLDQTLFSHCSLTPEDFSSPALGEIFRQLLILHDNGQMPAAAALAGVLEPELMSHLAGILQKPESMAHSGQAMADYIRIIESESDKRRSGGDIDPLLAAKDKFKNKMGYGGKQSG